MIPATPSHTALRVALRRAAHQLYDDPVIFADPVAIPILGDTYAEALHRTPDRPDRPWSTALRAFLVARSRYAEDALAQSVSGAIRQYVLLGAGLDTFAHRNPHPHLRVFEVDHPATQEWKQQLLARAHLPAPANLTYVPVDFETGSLLAQLTRCGFDPSQPAFFAWLGVVPYLTLAAFRATLNALSTLSPGTALALDYAQPRSALPPLEQLALDSLATRVRQRGEPFQLFFMPAQIAAELQAFSLLEDLGRDQINARYFTPNGQPRPDHLQVRGQAGRFLLAYKKQANQAAHQS